ncbi:zinc finger CCHC domain-containing protein 10-like [Eurosta solidaginis]|uniref:zinc finger CCHC domain-containing protein 10-like n=1 Tax=Eurosta solidaginis TaxID=178769 RepID=UPI003531605F
MQKIYFLLFGILLYCVESLPAPEPQDFQTAALMLSGQFKDIIDNSDAARDETKFEFFGARISNNMAMGFGDTMRMPGGRRRRETDTQGTGACAENSKSFDWDYSSAFDYSYESGELGGSKYVGKGEQRKRRSVSGSSSAQSSSSSMSVSSSSSSSSSSSESLSASEEYEEN